MSQFVFTHQRNNKGLTKVAYVDRIFRLQGENFRDHYFRLTRRFSYNFIETTNDF